MPRFLLGWLLSLAGSAIGLLLATLLLGDSFRIDGPVGFVISVIVFAIVSAISTWATVKTLSAKDNSRKASGLLPLAGLISTLLALVITVLFTNGLSVSGWGWILGSLIVWILGLVIWVIPGPWRDFRGPREVRR